MTSTQPEQPDQPDTDPTPAEQPIGSPDETAGDHEDRPDHGTEHTEG